MKKSMVVVFVLAMVPPVFAQPAKYHATARFTAPSGRENKVFMFAADGTTLVGSYDQIQGAYGDAWGYRDGAFDGNRVYFGWGDGLASHPEDGLSDPGFLKFPNLSGLSIIRALAYDPRGDGSFWTADFGSNLVEIDFNTGQPIQSFPNLDAWSLYGLAYDDTDGNLWGHSTAGEVIKIDTTTGRTTGAGWPTAFVNLAAQGGLSGFSELPDGPAKLTALSQGTPDEGGNYDLAGNLVEGPWPWENITGSGGHLGVAVVPEPGMFMLLSVGGLVFTRRCNRPW